MGRFDVRYKPWGESTILIEWPAGISEVVLEDILALQEALEVAREIHPLETWNTYHALAAIYDPSRFSFSDISSKIKAIYKGQVLKDSRSKTLWKIPVCYDEEFGIDLKEMALQKEMDIHEIIQKHCWPIYTIYFIGFLPGFLYLGGLADELNFPRKPSPRLSVRRGAVAIGGRQTGVYPVESPGGWNIIGNSPLIFFDSASTLPCFARPGDKIKFYPIEKAEYARIAEQVKSGEYILLTERL